MAAFTSGQIVTAGMLNRATRNDLSVNQTSNLIIGAEADVPGLSLSVTTPQANTKLLVTASVDLSVGTGDFVVLRLYVNGAAVGGDMNRSTTGREPSSHTWTVPIASASTFTVKLRAQKLFGGGTSELYSGHTQMSVSGNGIS